MGTLYENACAMSSAPVCVLEFLEREREREEELVGVEFASSFDLLVCCITTGMLDSDMQPAVKGRNTSLSIRSLMLQQIVRLIGGIRLLEYICYVLALFLSYNYTE